MTIQTFRSRAILPLVLFGCVTPLTTLCAQDDQTFLPPAPEEPGNPAAAGDDFEVLSRGVVHEAFAEQYNQDPVPGLTVDKEPPEPIDELPPETMPEGNNVQWVSGYFAWDEDLSDFVWISGFWRDFPPGQRWVPGYWNPTDDGRYQWVSGFWTPEQTAELDYLPYPPESLEQGPNIAAPSDNYYWVPGCWVWQNYDYSWRPGYWQLGYDDWVWYPDRYTWTPRGAIFCPGFYDYRIPYRGTLFAPVYFPRLSHWRQHYGYYTPGITIGLNNLALHLFVRPSYGHYYFGDYYGSRYAGFGFQPWYLGGGFGFGRGYGFYDPLLVFYNNYHHRHHGINYAGRLRSWHNYYNDHEDHRPRRTFREERNFVARHGDHDGHDHDHVRQAVLTQSIDEHVRSDSRREFRHIDQAERENHSRSSRHVRELTNLRRGSERADEVPEVALGTQPDRGNDGRNGHSNGRNEIGNSGGSSSQPGDERREQRQRSLALPEVEPRHGNEHGHDRDQERGSRSRTTNVPDVATMPARPGQGGSQQRRIDRGVPSSQFQPSQPGQNQVDRGVDLTRQRGSSGSQSDRGSSRSSRSSERGSSGSQSQSRQILPQVQSPSSSRGSSRSNRSSGRGSSGSQSQPTPQIVPRVQSPSPSQGSSSRSRSQSSGSSSRFLQQPQPPSAGSSRGSSSRSGSSSGALRSPTPRIPSGSSSGASRSSGRSLQSPSRSSRSSSSSGLRSSGSRSSGSSGASRGSSRSRGSSSASRSRSSAPRASSSSSARRPSSSSRSSSSRGSSRSSSSRGSSRSSRRNK